MSVFSERIISLRKSKGVTQASAAKEIGISGSAYQKYEYGESEPTLPIAIRMADFYGVSLDYLAGRTDKEHRAIFASLDGLEQQLEELKKPLEGIKKEVQALKKQMMKTG